MTDSHKQSEVNLVQFSGYFGDKSQMKRKGQARQIKSSTVTLRNNKSQNLSSRECSENSKYSNGEEETNQNKQPFSGENFRKLFHFANDFIIMHSRPFAFESKRNQVRKQTQPFDKPFLLCSGLEYNLFRHKLFSLMRKETEQLPSTIGIQKQLKLLRLIFMHCPFKDPQRSVEKRFLNTSEIFKYKDFAENETTDIDKDVNELKDCLKWAKGKYLLTPIQDNLEKLMRAITGSNLLEEDKIAEKMKNVKANLLERIKSKIDNINTESFYYIESRLENAFEMLQQDGEVSDIKRFKNIAREICSCLRKSAQKFTVFVMKENYNEELREEWEEALCLNSLDLLLEGEESLPDEIWGELLAGFQSFVNRVEIMLSSDLSYKSGDEVECNLKTLIQDPFSFIRHRKLLNVQWRLVQILLNNYEKLSTDQEQNQEEEYSDQFVELPFIICDLLTLWSYEGFNMEKKKIEKLYKKVAFPIYYSKSQKDISDRNCNIYSLCTKIDPTKVEQDLMEKELTELIIRDFSNIDLSQLMQFFYEKEEQMSNLEDIKIIIYSNTCGKIRDLPPEISEKTKSIFKTNAEDIEKRKLSLSGLFQVLSSEPEDHNNTNLQDQKETLKALTEHNMTYFNYKFLESVLTSNDINLSPRTYFVSEKRLQDNSNLQYFNQSIASTNELTRKIIFPFHM